MVSQKLLSIGRRNRGSGDSERGAALVIALLVMLVLSLLGGGLLSVSFTETQVAFNDRRMIQALFNAEAALEEAKLRLSPTADPAIRITPVNNATWGVYLYTPGHATDYRTFDPQYQATYTGTLSVQNAIEWGVAKVRVKDPSVNPPSILVTAWGADGPIRRQLELELEPIVSGNPTNDDVAHGKKNVRVSGNGCTNSYDSSLPTFLPTAQGGISTEGASENSIRLDGTAVVGGNVVIFNSSANPDTVVSPEERIHVVGTVSTTSSSPPAIPSGTIPPGAVPLNSDRGKNDLKLSGNSIRVVPEGVYWVNKLDISGNAQLVTTGNVTIYVVESVKVSGNATFAPKDLKPRNLTLFVGAADDDDFSDLGYDGGKVQLTGDANLYAVIYGADAKVKITGSGNFYGAIRAKAVKIAGNGCAYYDLALNSGGGGSVTGYNRKAWREVMN